MKTTMWIRALFRPSRRVILTYNFSHAYVNYIYNKPSIRGPPQSRAMWSANENWFSNRRFTVFSSCFSSCTRKPPKLNRKKNLAMTGFEPAGTNIDCRSTALPILQVIYASSVCFNPISVNYQIDVILNEASIRLKQGPRLSSNKTHNITNIFVSSRISILKSHGCSYFSTSFCCSSLLNLPPPPHHTQASFPHPHPLIESPN